MSRISSIGRSAESTKAQHPCLLIARTARIPIFAYVQVLGHRNLGTLGSHTLYGFVNIGYRAPIAPISSAYPAGQQAWFFTSDR
jgi:hypothetical protein